MAAPKKYSDELRERATRMALDAIEAEGQRMVAIRRPTAPGQELGHGQTILTLREWS